ncbi:MAG: type II secretion system F family protein [Desulfobulbaceae bacterium]|nr:type II secretion system F family protein [Desulfobulbaceae bacterium]
MQRFSYQALTDSGSTVNGVIEAPSIDEAAEKVAAMGHIPVMVAAEKGPGILSLNWDELNVRLTKITPRDIILFTKQFRTMLKAGIAIVSLLETLEQQTENVKLKKIARTMAADIQGGASLYEAFGKHPDTFSPLYRGMVRAGESSGALPEVLDRIAYILDHEHKVKSDIKSALQYPLIVVVFLTIAFFVLLTFVIPKFITIFKAANIKLPLPTVICMAMYNFLANYYPALLALLFGTVVGLSLYLKTEAGTFQRDRLLLRLPLIGPLFVKSAMSRFASIFSILQTSGVGVLESISILSGTIGNSAIAKEFDRIRNLLEEGRGIAEPLREARYFPPMVINMVSIGEETGDLDHLLKEISTHYDYEVEYATKRLADAIGPALTVGLAVVVGFFALAIFLPMWDLTKMVK